MSAPHGRFAPSPTGPLHLGNLRTALLAWLMARRQGARFLVRVDDLDQVRSRPEHERGQLADLRALGLAWDGEVVRQSTRLDRYAAAITQLDRRGLLYPCFCTRQEIREAVSAPHGTLPEGVYPGTCRHLTAAEQRERGGAGRPPALRIRAEGARIGFDDRLRGRVEGIVDDLVIRRNDGAPAYNLAVVIDDAEQSIGEVVRGADLADATPGQLFLGRHLALDSPTFAHVPLLLGPDGARLSKRHGAVTLADRMARGESPAEVLGLLAATLGLAEPGESPTLDELLDRFDPGALPTEPSVLAGAL